MVVTLILLAFGLGQARYPTFSTELFRPIPDGSAKISVNQYPGVTHPFYPPKHKKHPPPEYHSVKMSAN
ncbi:hypothetical protein CARUB_v10019304mg [Capsella rubella]|uniref:Secreted protein n=1 Tax=Capsella rubella TaxID=81985 RepID=R0FSU0_9BRAS|nr:uncharacterized protein LOC17884890 [Capsella rubella]EOA25922.1 hypothetical protein CARUB_v10019304mg [Capsella rubella]